MNKLYLEKTGFLILVFLLSSYFLQAQGYTNWVTGDPTDATPANFKSGVVLAGGGGDNDDAMQWMLERADGGDVVVIRASNSDGYNDYFFSELGVNVNSVETIRFDNIAASSDDYVIQQIRNAEVLFIAGGDQYDYYQFWKDNAIEEAINFLINEKKITVGGTSAGMAILGNAYYTPSAGSLTTEQALANPYHTNVEILGHDDFIHIPLLNNLVTDTHFDDRDRGGRQVVFLARLVENYHEQVFGIACNEWTAVCVDDTGIARVFGEYPDYDEYAYFLKSNCFSEIGGEVIQPNTPLTWNRGGQAVNVYQAPGRIDGSTTFDLNDWKTSSGGNWQNWFVENGNLIKVATTETGCEDEPLSTLEEDKKMMSLVSISPNPTSDCWRISNLPKDVVQISIFSTTGIKLKELSEETLSHEICLSNVMHQVLLLKIKTSKMTFTTKLMRL